MLKRFAPILATALCLAMWSVSTLRAADGSRIVHYSATDIVRFIMPDGYSVSLDQFKGLDQEGATALRDKVNNHYARIFGASLAVGMLGGLAQVEKVTRLDSVTTASSWAQAIS